MWVDFKALTALIPVSAVAKRLGWHQVAYIPASRSARGPCPLHKGSYARSTTFQVQDDRGYYRCFKCGRHGDVIQLYADHYGISRRAAALQLVEDFRLTPDQVSGEE